MPLDPHVWDTDDPDFRSPGVSDCDLNAFEEAHRLKLPALFRAMYRLQNGGRLRDVEEVERFAPLGQAAQWDIPVSTVQKLAERNVLFSLHELDEIKEEFGNPRRLVVIAVNYGHTAYVLKYGTGKKSKPEPSVIYIDLEGGSSRKVAPSFDKWIAQIVGTHQESGVDWEERNKYAILREATFDASDDQGRNVTIDNVLCNDGRGGLILFTRTRHQGQTVGMERNALPMGVDERWLRVSPFRHVPITFALQLQPIDPDDLHCVECRRNSNGQWRVRRSRGEPVYCLAESPEHPELHELAETLKKHGLVHRPAPGRVDYDAMLQQTVSSTEAVLDLLDQIMRDKAVEPHRDAFTAALETFDRSHKELSNGLPGPTGINLALLRWIQHPTHQRMEQAWGKLTTEHRGLLKNNRTLFKPLSDQFL